VAGGTFARAYDGVGYTETSHPAIVSSFRLDAVEITVGRFRRFVAASMGGWSPEPGSGKHMHLNQGSGLIVVGGTGARFEGGWDASWSSLFPSTAAAWNAHLACDRNFATWTPDPAGNERLPITCIDWYDAYAFCIWDVDRQDVPAFLPTSAEWNYAAAGGNEQRVYAWGNQPPGPDTMLAIWGLYYGQASGVPNVYEIAPVGTVPAGHGKWGQEDLTGSVFEWNLDSPGEANPCVDCVFADGSGSDSGAAARVLRGGAYDSSQLKLPVSRVDSSLPGVGHANVGARCARVP
jgi:formylglycine-generating enzyme required for sulfatase activity